MSTENKTLENSAACGIEEQYGPMNILVTGSTGFVGTPLVNRLREMENVVYPFDRSLGDDVLNASDFDPFLDKEIDAVLHLAGLTFVPDSWKNPADFYLVNTLGTQHVLDFCKETKAHHIFASAYIYGIPQYLPIDEHHPVAPNNPYAHAKWLAEELCRFYALEMDVKSIVLRPFNLYGPGQPANFLIPMIIGQIQRGEEIVVKDDAPCRDYLHVDDFVNALIHCIKYFDLPFRIFNVGSGHSLSVKEIVESAIRGSGTETTWRTTGITRKNEIPDTVANCNAIRRALNWHPIVSFDEGIRSLINLRRDSHGRL